MSGSSGIGGHRAVPRTESSDGGRIEAGDEGRSHEATPVAVCAVFCGASASGDDKADEAGRVVRERFARGAIRFATGMSFAGRIGGKVLGTSDRVNLVVVSAGATAGILEGDRVIVVRDGKEVAKIVVDAVDKKWCVGRVVEGGPVEAGDLCRVKE